MQLASVRSLHLTTPVRLLPDPELIAQYRNAGGQVAEPAARPFRVVFGDGNTLQGDTRGFVRIEHGLFLHLITHDDLVVRAFVPAPAFVSFRVGTLLGEQLINSGEINRGDVEKALGTQAQRRQTLLDAHFGDVPIADAKTLAAAVEKRGAPSSHVRIGDILLNQGLVSRDQLFEALLRQRPNQRSTLGSLLAEMGALTPARVAQAVADQLGVPVVALKGFAIDPAVIAMVDSAFAIEHQVIPLLATEHALIVAVENPVDAGYLDALRFATQRQVIPVIASSGDLAARIEAEYAPKVLAVRSASIRDEIEDLKRRLASASGNLQGTSANRQVSESDTLLVRLVNKMIIDAYEQGASDIHVEAYSDDAPTKIRFRIDGTLSDYQELPTVLRSALISRLKIMASLDISEHRKPQDGKIDFQRFAPLKVELRVASLPTANGLEDIVMRLLSSSKPIPVDKLGMGAALEGQLKAMVRRTYGLILVCGPTGSGKTTTLHSLLAELNTSENKIWTAEDPIEITHPGLRQIQMIPRAGLTFATAMRAFLRADPDIIMVGEMRDAETTKIAVEASLTGHLVLSTLHTNSAPESVVRLLDMGLDPFNFADALLGVLGQRLARRLCADCKVPMEDAADQLLPMAQEYCAETTLDLTEVLAEWQARYGTPEGGKPVLYKAVGCAHCHDSGYRGRVGVYELMTATPAIKKLIQERRPVEALFQQAMADGMLRLRQYGLLTVLQGLTDWRSIRSACA